MSASAVDVLLAPVQPPVADEYLAGLMDSCLRVDALSTGVRVSLVSSHMGTIGVVRGSFKTAKETVSFTDGKPPKVCVVLGEEDQARALEIAATSCLVMAKVATAALALLAVHKEETADAERLANARAALKTAIGETNSVTPTEEVLAKIQPATPEYAAAVLDQYALPVLPKQPKAAESEPEPVVVESEPEEEEEPEDGKKKKKTKAKKAKKAKPAPKPRFGKVCVNLKKPHVAIVQSIRVFGGSTQKNGPHRLTIREPDANDWLADVLPEMKISYKAFDTLSVA